MTVGDTKSIVLALQALQEKIRKLETDRNFHQEQCEKSHKAHESYKLEVESQLDSERSQHRSREQELQDLLARANAERHRLQSTLEESKSDVAHFRVELEQLLESERGQAQSREDQLRSELEQLRSDIHEERRQNEQLLTSMDQLKTEKEIIATTNRRLESTVRELISVNNNLMDSVKKGGAAVINSGIGRMTSPHYVASHADPAASHNVSTASHRRTGSSQRRTKPSAASYMNPTHSSAMRDSRSGEVTARCPTPPRPASPRSARSLNTSSAIQPSQVYAMDDVHTELQNELRDLEAKYKKTIQDAAKSDTSPDVLNIALNTLMGQIQRKTEQLRLMRQTREELSAAAGITETRGRPKTTARGVDKALHRGQIVSELRALFAKPAY
jgi:chromosome segregation ATPase